MHIQQSVKRVFQLGTTYPRQVARVRVAVGIWLLLLTAILYGSGHGGHWAWLLTVTAAVHFVWAYVLFRFARRNPDRRVSLQ